MTEFTTDYTRSEFINNDKITSINPKIREDRNGDTLISDNTVPDSTAPTKNIRDSSWLRSAFMLPDIYLEDVDSLNRYWTTAEGKFTDTSIGGNIGVNARPQFTRYSDPRSKGRVSGRVDVTKSSITGNYGMGHYYSEAIDDNAQTIYLEFGVPKFSGLLRFFSLAVDPNQSYLANNGRSSAAYAAAKAVGSYLSLKRFPIIGSIYFITNIASKLVPIFTASSKYYYMKPTMHIYWATVNSLVSNMSVNLGILHSSLTKDGAGSLGLPMKLDTVSMEHLQELMPNILTGDGYIDVYAMANRAQILANRQAKEDFEKYDSATSDFNFQGYLKKTYYDKVNFPKGEHTFANYIRNFITPDNVEYGDGGKDVESKEGQKSITGESETEATIIDTLKGATDVVGDAIYERFKLSEKWLKQSVDYFAASAADGASFAIFKVNYTGSVSESFSTNVKDPAIKSTLNGIGGASRDIKFNLGGGSIVGGQLESFVTGVIDEAANVAKGFIDGVTLNLTGILTALLGGGFIDVPKQWDDSSVTLPKLNYTIDLVSPYGNNISQLQNIYIPLAMLLAGALPLATGKQSYTSPFLCSVYDRGRQHIKLGIMESLSITRGTTNLGFSRQGRPLGVEVSFSIVDLSSVMSMPVTDGGIINIDMGVDDDHLLGNYLNVLTGRDLYSQRYLAPQAKIAWAKTLNKFNSAFSSANWGMWAGESFLGMVSNLIPGASVIVNDTNK